MATQNDMILDHLKSGKSLTALQALDLFQCFRLASRISELITSGENILSDKIRLPSGKYVSKYFMYV